MHTQDIATEALDPVSTSARMDDARKRAPIELRVVSSSPVSHRADLLVVGAFADGTLSEAGQALDQASGGRLAALLKRGDLHGKRGASLLLYDLPGVARSGQ